jgi:hypothetical protein
MAAPINTPSAGEIWHLSIEDLFAPVQESQRLGGEGPFVINLSVSTAPINLPAKSFLGYEYAHVYQIQVTEDGRTRYRLRLGPFASEDDVDAIMGAVREIYPGALTATAGTADQRNIAALQAKLDAIKAKTQKAPQEPAPELAAPEIVIDLSPIADMRETATVAKLEELWPTKSAEPLKVMPVPALPPPAPSHTPTEQAAPTRSPPVLTEVVELPVKPETHPAPVITEAIAPASTIAVPTPAAVKPPPKAARPTSKPVLQARKFVKPPPRFTVPVRKIAGAALKFTMPPSALAAVTSKVDAPKEWSLWRGTTVASATPTLPVAEPKVAAPALKEPTETKALAPDTSVLELELVMAEPHSPAPQVPAPEPKAITETKALAPDTVVPELELAMSEPRVAAVEPKKAVAPEPKVAAQGKAPVPARKFAAPKAPAATQAAVVPNRHAPNPSPAPPRPAPSRPAPAHLVAVADVPPPRPVKKLSEPLTDLESTQTVRALTAPELTDDQGMRWYVIQLALSEHAFDPDAVPNLDIFSEYRLYSVAGIDQGRIVHALRLGFFSEEIAAVAVASYLAAHYDKPTIRRVSVAERERFAEQRVEARKDIGETGRHAAIEITNELVARYRRSSNTAAATESSGQVPALRSPSLR